MGSSLSPLDFLIGPGTQTPAPAAMAAQGPQVTPAQGTAPASPLAALPGYNDAVAQQAQSYLGDTMGKPKTPHDYMLEAMGIAPGQEDNKTKKDKFLHRLGVIGQVLAGRNFANEGQQKYAVTQDALKQAESERANQQKMGFEQQQNERFLNQPYITKAADLDYQKKLQDQQFEYGKKKLAYFQSLPFWDGLPDIGKANLVAQTLGLKGASIPASLQRSQTIKVSAAGLDPTVRQTYGLPEEGPVTIMQDPLTHHITGAYAGWAGNGTAYDENGNGFLFDKANPSKRNYIPGAKNPAFAKTTRTEYKPVSTVDDNGNPVTELVPVSVTSQKGNGSTATPAAALMNAQPPAQVTPTAAPQSPEAAPSGTAPTPYGTATNSLPSQPAPPVPAQRPSVPAIKQAATNARPSNGGILSFVKPLTPEQQNKMDMNLANVNTSIKRLNSIHDNLSAADNSIVAKAIQLQTDPQTGLVHMILNRNVPLNPQQQKLAADLISMREDINNLRGPLGATGFRGPQAFDAMVGQAGSLATNPEIAKKVIENTLESYNNIKNAYTKTLSRRNGKPAAETPGVLPGNISLADIDAEIARRKAKK